MITIRFKILKIFVLGALVASLLLPPFFVFAAEEDELVCDPLPEDQDQILLCNLYDILNPDFRDYEPGEDPANPIQIPATGTWGMTGVYNPVTDKIFIFTSTEVAKEKRPVVLFILNSKTFAIEKGPVQVNQDPNLYHAGVPIIRYNPDKKNFLAVWEDSRNGDNKRHTYGRFIGSDGTPLASDFAVESGRNAFLRSLEYDWKRQEFVVLWDGDGIFYKTVGSNGNVGPTVTIPPSPGAEYEGQSHLVFNPQLNQYWLVVASCIAADAVNEDCKVLVYKIDPETGKKIGQPAVMSKQIIGRNTIASPSIVYSPHDKAAAVAWYQGPNRGTVGRTLYNDGSLSSEYEILTVKNFPFSQAYGGPKLNFNQWTNTIFTTTEDDHGGTMLAEFNTDGLVLNIHQAIAPPPDTGAAYGTFIPNNFVTNMGAIAMGTYYYSQLVLTFTPSPAGYYIGNEEQLPEGDVKGIVLGHTTEHAEEFPKLISKIYIWSLGVAGVLALLMTTAGAITYLSAAGNAEKATKGSEMIWGSVIGLALLFGAYLLLNTINPNLVNFSIKSIGDLKSTGVRPGTPFYSTGYVNKPVVPADAKAYSTQEVKNLISKYAQEFGVDPKIPLEIARCESSEKYKWNAQNPLPQSSASGVFQFVNKTWAGTPEGKSGKSVFDADANVRAAVRMIKQTGTGDWDASKGCWGPRI